MKRVAWEVARRRTSGSEFEVCRASFSRLAWLRSGLSFGASGSSQSVGFQFCVWDGIFAGKFWKTRALQRIRVKSGCEYIPETYADKNAGMPYYCMGLNFTHILVPCIPISPQYQISQIDLNMILVIIEACCMEIQQPECQGVMATDNQRGLRLGRLSAKEPVA